MARIVPIIDISPFLDGTDREGVVARVRDACETIGFLVISGHGVPRPTLDGVLAATKSFFALPVDTKKKYVRKPGAAGRGYSEFANMSLGQ